MLTCGLKLTHDSCVSVVEDDGRDARLVGSVEWEKIGNHARHALLTDLDAVPEPLAGWGIAPSDVDRWVVDGWGRGAGAWMLRRGPREPIWLAGYSDESASDRAGDRFDFDGLAIGGVRYAYSSYRHVTTHVASAYATSPFAAAGADALVLVWDGGTCPRLYRVDGGSGAIEHVRTLFPMIGHAHGSFAAHFAPFRHEATVRELEHGDEDLEGDTNESGVVSATLAYNLAVTGKSMAYAGLGSVRPDLAAVLREAFARGGADGGRGIHRLCAAVEAYLGRAAEESAADVFATYQAFVGELLVEGLAAADHACPNLCYAGGCALNIKWNAAIRDAGIFEAVWVPPFANDSGSAIGAACADLADRGVRGPLEWDVYAGPGIREGEVPPGWTRAPCGPAELGRLIAREGTPVLLLDGRAELGPRALGNRSILAPAHPVEMRDLLNAVKEREPYRPVSPICTEEAAAAIFEPGGPEPFMLFEHRVRTEWRMRIPAAVHTDGSARLQTVNRAQNAVVHAVLTAYGEETGVPVLCNTSANLPGRGFFPDVASALRWGRIPYTWSEGVLYSLAAGPAFRTSV